MLKCRMCEQDLAESKFTKFDRNPIFAKERKGRVPICRECANKYVHEREDTIESLKEILQMQDIPYVERYAKQARDNYIKKLKKTKIVTKESMYNGKVEKSKETINIQTSIYTCYCSKLGVIPKSYINHTFSDGIRDNTLEAKIEKMEDLLKQTEDTDAKEVKSAKNFLMKMFGNNCFDDNDKLYNLIFLKTQELDLHSSDGKMRARKCTLKKHINKLIETNNLDNKFMDIFEENTPVEEKEENISLVDAFDYDILELKKKWGNKFDDEVLVEFENKYQELIKNYEIQTTLHEEFLKGACSSSVLGARALANGDSQEAKRYFDIFKDMTSGGKNLLL